MKISFKYLLLFLLFFSNPYMITAQYVTLGTANLTNSSLFMTSMDDSKSKLIFTDAELSSNPTPLLAGDTIFSIGWEVSSGVSNSQSMYNTNIIITELGVSNVVWSGKFSPKIGWNDFQLSLPYIRSFSDSLIIEFCFDNCVNTSAISVFASQVTSSSLFSSKSANNDNGCSLNPNIFSDIRPNTRFGITNLAGDTTFISSCSGTSEFLTSVSLISPTLTLTDFTYNGSYTGSYYFLSNSTKNWVKADLHCKQYGGELVSISNQSENNFVSGFFSGNIWTGLNQNCNSGSFSEPSGGFEWSDGSALSYTNWNGGEPNDHPNNNINNQEDYVEMRNNGTWNDHNFNIINRYVMEIENTYLWNTGQTTSYILVNPNTTTTYWVDHTLGNQKVREYFTINIGIEGCTDPLALNYDSIAICDNLTCLYVGCTDSLAFNYDSIATIDDGSCIFYGCIDTNACNYDALANSDDGSCLSNYGCLDSSSCNYDSLATCDNGSCVYDYSIINIVNSCTTDSTGEISILISPNIIGVNYTYSIYGLSSSQSIPYNIVTDSLPSGYYNVEIFANSFSCSTQQVYIPEYPELIATINSNDESCEGFSDGNASLNLQNNSNNLGTVSLLNYCASNPSPNLIAQPQTIIEEVQLTGDNFDIYSNTAGVNDFYDDFTNNSGQNGEFADITRGSSYTVYLKPGNLGSVAYDPEAINIYIDFNIDGDFDDAGEDIGEIIIPFGTWISGTVYPFTFTVPNSGLYGPTRMRVVCISNSGQAQINIGPCQSPIGSSTPWFGGTEDYSLVINSPGISSLQWSNGALTDSIFSLSPGAYDVNIIDLNGCTTTANTTINTVTLLPIIYAGSSIYVCAGNSFTITDATASNYDSLLWTSSGSGMFTGENTISPSYTPSNADINSGYIILTLNAESFNSCPSMSSSIAITIEPIPNTGLILHN